MTAAAATKKTKKQRTLSYNAAVGVLHLRHEGAAEVGYYLDRLDAPAGGVAFRLTKIVPPTKPNEPSHYDVRLADDGDSCECMGWLRWGRCKHRDALRCLRVRGSV